jgi:hypothetical protein
MLGITLLASPCTMFAQHGGGGGGGGGMGGGSAAGAGGGRNTTPLICVHDCRTLTEGLDTTDYLKNFRRAMAVQANAEQRAAFAKVTQYTQAASDQLQAFRESLQKVPASSPLSDRTTAMDQAIEKARAGSQNFLTSFSSAQKSGLEDTTKKLGKADSELDKQIKALDQIVQIVQTAKPGSEQISNSAANLDKALAGFQNEQLALGREMSILFDPAGQGVTFSLPAVTNSISVDGQSISIPASGAVSRVSAATPAEDGHNLFNLKLVADLSDLQLNVTRILRSELTRAPRCGERIEILQATLIPLEPASLVVARVHFERWVCPPGQQSPTEVAAGEATIEVKLTPSLEPAIEAKAEPKSEPKSEPTIGPNAPLHLVSEITRVDATGFLRNSLRSGDLGVTLREQIAASLLSALQQVANLRTTLPPVAQESATLQKAQFQDAGADQLNLVLDGQLQFSDEQTQQFAAQLKQRLSAQGASPQ